MHEDVSKSMDDFSDLYERAKRNEKIMKEGREAVEFFKRKGLIEYPVRSNRGRPRKAN